MKFNTANQVEKKEAFSYFTRLANKKQIIEIKKVSPKRTLSQNSYLHLIIGAFGAHFGYTMEEAKQIYKEINMTVYLYRKENRGITREFWRSSADLTKEEMMQTIDRFRQKSEEAGYPLPDAEDTEWQRQLENEVERHMTYL